MHPKDSRRLDNVPIGIGAVQRGPVGRAATSAAHVRPPGVRPHSGDLLVSASMDPGRELRPDEGSPSFRARPFRPARWAPGPHAQTLLARALRSPSGPKFRRERIETPDGDFLDVDWAPDPGERAPVVLVIHGLEGSSRRSYIRSVCRDLLARGIRPVAMNFRGCGGEMNRAPRFYHSGETGDPTFLLETIRKRYPERRFGALGFSLGGNVLLKLMGERGDGGRGLLDAAAAMSVPYDLAAGADLLERTRMGRVYSAYFLRSLRRKALAKAELLHGRVHLDGLRRAGTLRAFDDAVTAPLHGFRDATDYYEASSSAAFLSGIRVPTLLLQSRDDPFLPPAMIPLDAMEANPVLVPALTARGGHVGFLEGLPWRPRFWGDEEAARFLGEVLLRS